ncbi:amidohydrolase family protein [Amycolatopsis sp. YIM 10]|uniref:amidohydrolase family protein n=1 Tax=Amycolatopsis sp. YIM 10 TaxID=2653857 RepID=UPI0012A7DCC6|nr:amidohydrolase family protein [Amycolatopsis sp. YIM 10]QFU94699.1 imidazolonepropionase [Amycolatopsis sp. YIM 10]
MTPVDLALLHATVIDATGGRPRPDATLVVRAGRITALGRFGDTHVPRGLRKLDLRGKFVVPGLCDVRVHGGDPALFLANGVTTARAPLPPRRVPLDPVEFVRPPAHHVPTLARHAVLDRPSLLSADDYRLKYLPPTERDGWRWALEKLRRKPDRAALFEHRLRFTGALHRAGVPILAGTDTGTPWVFPGFALHEELAFLVEAGCTPMQALQSATKEAARYLGRSATHGTIAVGKVADLLILDADPLLDIRNTRKIHSVLTRGTHLTPTARAQLLATTAAA